MLTLTLCKYLNLNFVQDLRSVCWNKLHCFLTVKTFYKIRGRIISAGTNKMTTMWTWEQTLTRGRKKNCILVVRSTTGYAVKLGGKPANTGPGQKQAVCWRKMAKKSKINWRPLWNPKAAAGGVHLQLQPLLLLICGY